MTSESEGSTNMNASPKRRNVVVGEPLVYVIWNVDKRQVYLKICHLSRSASDKFLEELLLPYEPRDGWRRKLRVAGPMPRRTTWEVKDANDVKDSEKGKVQS